MKFQKQTRTHKPNEGIIGNCMMSCYANYLDFDVEECPRIELMFECTRPRGFWWFCVQMWWEQYGYTITYGTKEDAVIDAIGDDYYFVSGPSPRDPNINHLVIYKNREMVFDPHPDGTGIITDDVNKLGFEYVKKNS